MIHPIRTYSDPYLQRHRDTHAKHAVFGTHRHPYLHATLHALAVAWAEANGEKPSLLDYGCGKGVFMAQMTGLGVFRYIRGFDPAVDGFKERPTQRYDFVTCLDVLDQLEAEFVDPAIQDVGQLTGGTAVFNVITRQSPDFEHLNPRSASTWREIIDRHMQVNETTIRAAPPEEIAQGGCPERVIILAAPRGAG